MKPIHAAASMLALSVVAVTVALGYDRAQTAAYAVQWGVPNVVNSTVYYNYGPSGGDCANFGSQCLIAGGIRFRSRASSTPNDNTTDQYRDELGTGQTTVYIVSGDMARYSRTITNADKIVASLLHVRHGGTLFQVPDLVDTGSVWQHVKPGDLLMTYKGFPTYYTHTMVINDVVQEAGVMDVYDLFQPLWHRTTAS